MALLFSNTNAFKAFKDAPYFEFAQGTSLTGKYPGPNSDP